MMLFWPQIGSFSLTIVKNSTISLLNIVCLKMAAILIFYATISAFRNGSPNM
jgi:hypothetical protein